MSFQLSARCERDIVAQPALALTCPECAGVNAGAFHLAVANIIGRGEFSILFREQNIFDVKSDEISGKQALVADIDRGSRENLHRGMNTRLDHNRTNAQAHTYVYHIHIHIYTYTHTLSLTSSYSSHSRTRDAKEHSRMQVRRLEQASVCLLFSPPVAHACCSR